VRRLKTVNCKKASLLLTEILDMPLSRTVNPHTVFFGPRLLFLELSVSQSVCQSVPCHLHANLIRSTPQNADAVINTWPVAHSLGKFSPHLYAIFSFNNTSFKPHHSGRRHAQLRPVDIVRRKPRTDRNNADTPINILSNGTATIIV